LARTQPGAPQTAAGVSLLLDNRTLTRSVSKVRR
jgi:hypothetical protein